MFFTMSNFFYLKENKIFLTVSIVPNSSKTQIVGLYNDMLKVKLKSPPADNAANEELVRFLADQLNVLHKNVEIIRGHTKKRKILSISNCKCDNITRLITK